MDAFLGLLVTVGFLAVLSSAPAGLLARPCRCGNSFRGQGMARNPKCPVHGSAQYRRVQR
jgi:hypothetical protein